MLSHLEWSFDEEEDEDDVDEDEEGEERTVSDKHLKRVKFKEER